MPSKTYNSTKNQLDKLLEITEETHTCIENQLKLLKEFLDRTEGTGLSKQTTIDEHFKKTPLKRSNAIKTESSKTESSGVSKEMDWCMVEEDTPKKPPLRRSTRNRHPPKRMEGILMGDEMDKQMDKVDKFDLFNLSRPYFTHKKRLKTIFANYERMEEVLEEIPNCSETQEHGYMTYKDFKTTLIRLYRKQHSIPFPTGFFADCSRLFKLLSQPRKTIQEPVVGIVELMVALCVLFESDNLESMYEIFDFNQITYLYREELKQLLTTLYKTMCWIHGKEVDTQPLVDESIKKLDCSNEYSRISYGELNSFFESKF